MQGWHVPRRAGWDCHGLPVEIAVEQELGFAGKPDIERYGIAEFNARCRESVERHVDAFSELTRRMGYWVDMSTAYWTMDPELHRERLVVAQADLRQGPAGRGPPGRALLPALRHRAVRPRGRPGLRDRSPTRRSTSGCRSPAASGPARPTCWSGRRRRGRCRRTPPSPCTPTSPTSSPAAGRAAPSSSPSRCWPRCWARTAEVAGPHAGPRLGARALPAAVRAGRLPGRRRALRRPRRLRHHRGRHRAGAPVPRLRRRRPRRRAARYGLPVVNPIDADRALPGRRAAGRRALLQGRRRGAGRGPARTAACCSGSCATSTAIRTAGAATRR